MTRKLWVLATVAVFGVSTVGASVASACDEKAQAKTASATTSCCAKDGAKTASVDAKKVHKSAVKSAMVAPGAAPILNVASFGAMLTAGGSGDCDWCPTSVSASACATMSAAECAALKGSAVQTASYGGAIATPAGKSGCGSAITTAGIEGGNGVAAKSGCGSATTTASMKPISEGGNGVAAKSGCGAATTTASLNGMESSHTSAAMTMAAGGDGCKDKSAAANANAGHGSAGCCEANKTASAAGTKADCSTTKTASLKGKVDDMPYRENKRVVLAGASYACGHCSLDKTADCSPMIKTADGKVYPLLENNQAKQMKNAEGKNLEISGTVKKVDGVKFLDVKSYKVM